MVRRLLRCAALLAPLLILFAALPSGARPPDPPRPTVSASTRAAGTCPQTDFTEAVLCWGDAASRGERSIVVTVSEPQSLRADKGLDAVADAVPQLRDKLIVIVTDGVRTGNGGTFLLALASHRIVGLHSSISPLTAAEHRRLNDLAGCPPDGFCESVRARPRSGADLVDDRLAQDARTSLFTAGPTKATVPPDSGGEGDEGGEGDDGYAGDNGAAGTPTTDGSADDGLVVLLVVVTVLVGLVITMGVAVRRTGAPAGTPPQTTAAAAAAGPAPDPHPAQHRSTDRSRPSRPSRPSRASRRSAPGTAAPPQSSQQPQSSHQSEPSRQSEPSHEPEPSRPPERSQRREPPHRPDMSPQPGAVPAKPTVPQPTGGRTMHHLKSSRPSATVRTALRPQGYVDINGLLHRASWGGPGEPPPPGQPVDLVQESTGELTVYAHGAADDGPHGDHAAPHA